MLLKLSPTGLGSGIDKERQDYTVYSGGWDIGRIYETRGGPEHLRWFWSFASLAPGFDRRSLANDPDALARMLYQPESSCLLAYLILIPAKEPRRRRERLAVIEGVPEVFEVHLGPRLA